MSDEDVISKADQLLRRERWPSVQKQLPGICGEVEKLCSISYTHSLRYVVQRFSSAERAQGILAAVDSADRWASRLAGFFRLCESFDLNQQQVEMVFEMLVGVLSDLHRNGIEPFVRLVREEGRADASVLDGYGEFRRRWAKLVERTEELARLVGVRVDLSMYLTPDLHVPLKP